MATTPYTFRIDQELKNSLEQEAELEQRPAAQLATRAIKSMLDAKKAKREAIDLAAKEAQKGVFISEAKMNEWVDSWGEENELPPPEPDIFPK